MATELPNDPESIRQRLAALTRKKGSSGVSVDDFKLLLQHMQLETSSTKNELQSRLNSAQHDLSAKLARLQSDLDRGLADTSKELQKHSKEATSFSERLNAGLQGELQAAAANLGARIDQDLQGMKAALQAEVQRAAEAAGSTDQRFEEARSGLTNAIAELQRYAATTHDETFAQQKHDHDETLKELHASMSQVSSDMQNRLSLMQDMQEKLHERQDQEARSTSAEFRQWLIKLESRTDQDRRSAEDQMESQARTTDDKLAQCRHWVDLHLDFFLRRTAHIRKLVSEVENMSTRRVEWSIPLDSMELQSSRSRGASWFSPKFEAGGSHDLQLELVLLQPGTSADEHFGDGDCAIRLWAKAGLYIMCKFYIGSASLQVEHTFDGSTPCGTRTFCFVADQIRQGSDSLTIGVEILEAIRHVPQEPWPAMLAALPSMPTTPSSPSSPTRERQPSRGALMASEEVGPSPVGTVMSHRYLIHRTLDLVEKQVDLMRSRMVRQIEWRLERASMLRRCFPEGECACSTTFEAAGVDGLQLVFYPSGYKGAREGFCSFFLQCPAGSMLKCWLAAGKQRREASARLTFEKPGFFGRTNFCRFDSCVDPSDDSVLLVLEIEEAEQTVTSVNVQSQESACQPLSPAATIAGDHSVQLPDKIDSSVRLRRTPGKIGLEDVRQLPSIWTPRPLGDIAGTLEGFHTFNDLKAARRPNSSRKHYTGVPWKADISASALHQTTSQLAQKYIMYAA